jgi:hypothetical protein
MLEQNTTCESTNPDLTAIHDRTIISLISSAGEKDANLFEISIKMVDHILKNHFGFENFFLFERERESLISKLTILVKKFPNHNLNNKIILDLGCGNLGNTAENSEKDSRNHPWFCRILQILGARPIGIDIGNLGGEKFEHLQMDLLKDNALKEIPRESIDAVTTDRLYNSPHLLEMKILDPLIPNNDLRKKLFPQIQRILKPDGFYLEEDAVEYGKYQTIDKYRLDHEDRSKREVVELMEHHRKSTEFNSREIAQKISKLVFPYLMEEYNYKPDDEIADIIKFQCSAVMDLLINNVPNRNLKDQHIVEFDPRDRDAGNTRINEPWSSRFINMIGHGTLIIGFNENDKLPEQRDIYTMCSIPIDIPDECINAIIVPDLQTLSAEQNNFYLSKIRKYLKPDGFYIERRLNSVGIIKR